MDNIVHKLTTPEAENLVITLADLINAAQEEISYTGKVSRPYLWEDLKNTLNKLLEESGMRCTSIRMSNNIDKQEFDVYVIPQLSNFAVGNIICGREIEERKIMDYSLDIDLKLLTNYSAPTVVSVIVANIHSMANNKILDILNFALNAYMCNSGKATSGYILKLDYISNLDCGYGVEIMKYAMVSFLRRMYCMCDTCPIEPMWETPILQILNMNSILRKMCNDKFTNLRGGVETDSNIAMNVFEWALSIIADPKLHMHEAIDTLTTIRNTTGSDLERNWITRILNDIRFDTHSEDTLNEIRESFITEGFSLFKSLKVNGLRGIEDDLYEYKIRVKNCEEEEDAMYILRQINTRLTILDDYLRNTDKISDSERERWQSCINSYRELRAQIGQKKIGGKKQYGIFIDYDKLDQMYG